MACDLPVRTSEDGPTRRPHGRSRTGSIMYQRMGAHPDRIDGVDGVRFAVWAPNAKEVSVLTDAGHWQPSDGYYLWGSDSGVWSGFVPGMKHGDAYKFGVRTQEGHLLEKADPFAFYAEHPPKTASIVYESAASVAGRGWMSSDAKPSARTADFDLRGPPRLVATTNRRPAVFQLSRDGTCWSITPTRWATRTCS